MLRFLLSRVSISVLLLWGLVFAASVVLPSSYTGLFASPDETAVAVSLQQIEKTGSATLPESLAKSLPWLHPRSYVATGDSLVPIGFLGWPWWLAQAHRVLPLELLAILASLLAASGVIPWYCLLRKRFGSVAAWWGTALAWTFPPVLLYLNRSLFSHIPQLTAIMWALWLLVREESSTTSSLKKFGRQLVSGLLFGIGLSFRPIEAIWLLPVFALMWWSYARKITWKKQGGVLLGFILGLLSLLVVQAQTYGTWFQVGYWIEANQDLSAIVIPQLVSAEQARPWYLALAPYGLHPRTVWWNIRWFFLSFLLSWILAAVAAVFVLIWPHRLRVFSDLKRSVRKYLVPILVLGFFFGWVLLIYGSGFYTDHVRSGAVTVGNSFLRYTLPFGFAFAWLMAWVYASFPASAVRRRFVYSFVGAILILMGLYGAFIRDEEGILTTRRELIRYEAIRGEALKTFGPMDIILSDRSDKVFFPAMRAVSPMPSEQQLKSLSTYTSTTKLGLFARPMSLRDRDAWRRMGYDVSELGVFGRERLYHLTPFLR